MPEDKRFIYKAEAQLRFCKLNLYRMAYNVIWAITLVSYDIMVYLMILDVSPDA